MLVITSPHTMLVPLIISSAILRSAVSVNMVSFTNVPISPGNPVL